MQACHSERSEESHIEQCKLGTRVVASFTPAIFLQNLTVLGAPSRRPLRGCGFPFGLCESPTVLGRMWASAPTGLHIAVRIVQNPTLLGRMWASAPTGLYAAIGIVDLAERHRGRSLRRFASPSGCVIFLICAGYAQSPLSSHFLSSD